MILTNVKHIKTLPHPEGQLEIKQMDPPLSPELAWDIEAFLLKTFPLMGSIRTSWFRK